MRRAIWTTTAVLILASAAHAQQRGVVTGVTAPRSPAVAGVPVEITVTGTNPCGAVRIDPGDGTERVTHPITQVPTTVRYVYQRAGRFELRAEGMGNCDGVAAVAIQVAPAPAPPAVAPPPPTPVRSLRGMDADRDGVVTRAEWRGTTEDFRRHDTNGDGVLSGAEVQQDNPNQVIVRAAERWSDAGVYLREGDVVRIESGGTVQLSADTTDISSPGGAGSRRRAPSAPLPDHPAGGLIARIGEGRPLFVGAASTLRANATGLLYLGVNDDYLGDNRGEFRVTVDISRRNRYRR